MEAKFQQTPTGTGNTGADGREVDDSDKAPALDIRFDPSLTTDAPEWWRFADDLLADALPDRKRSRQAYRQNMVTVALNLCRAWAVSPVAAVRYSRTRGVYSKGFYNRLGITYDIAVQGCINALWDRGYLSGKKGYYTGAGGRRAYMRATDSLREWWEAYGVTLETVRHERECIVLRDRDKQDIHYDDTKAIKAMRQNLEWINTALSGLDIRLAPEGLEGTAKAPDYTERTLRRIFNRGRFTLGGRFFGHWAQRLESWQRGHIRINEKPVCELDFKGMAVNMLYLREGKPLPEDDVYDLPEQPGIDRDNVKLALQIMLNADSERRGMQAIRDNWEGDKPALKALEYFVLPDIRQRHPDLAQHFGTGVGRSLQFDESRIAEAVLLDMLDQDIPCIPVHDSFLVSPLHGTALHNSMTAHSRTILGTSLPIDRKF